MKKYIIKRLLILLIVLLIIPATSYYISAEQNKIQLLEEQLRKNPNDIDTLLRLGIAYFQAVLEGTDTLSEKAKQIFEKVILKNSKSSIAHTLYGKLLCYEGQRSWYPIVNITKTNLGIEEMHIGLQLEPDNIFLRLIRGSTLADLPESINGQKRFAIEDFSYIIKVYEESPEKVSKPIILDAYLNLCKINLKSNNLSSAKDNYKMLLEIDSNSEQADEAKRLFINKGIAP